MQDPGLSVIPDPKQAARTAKSHQAIVTRAPFREVSETVTGIDVRSKPILITRLFIRYVTRALGYPSARRVLSAVAAVIPRGGRRWQRYVRHLFAMNAARLAYIDRLASNDLRGAALEKEKWADLVLRDSTSLRARWAAKEYLAVVGRGARGVSDPAWCHRIARGRRSDQRFYLYGPNAGSPPSAQYSDFTIVLPKPSEFDVSRFAGSILFVNSMYHAKLTRDAALRSSVVEKYDRVFVSCRETDLSPPFVRAKFPMGGDIGGAMALGRILFNLVRAHGRFTCVIEGYDLYLQRDAYAPYYPHLARDHASTINERVICKALEDHDALYNFLYLKQIVATLDVVDSEPFMRIMRMTADEYLSALASVRDFGSLR